MTSALALALTSTLSCVNESYYQSKTVFHSGWISFRRSLSARKTQKLCIIHYQNERWLILTVKDNNIEQNRTEIRLLAAADN